MSGEIELLPSAIVRDPDFNCRKEASPGGGTTSPLDPFGQKEFDASILEQGVLQAPCVRRRGDEWLLVYGFRRVEASERLSPERPIRCTIMDSSGDEEIDAANARVLNLIENLHRADLRPWEIAEALFQLRSQSEFKSPQIAALTGLSSAYVRNLIRLRGKSHPEVWAQFKRWGTSMKIPYQDVLELTTLPQGRQLDAWNALVEAQKLRAKRGGRPKGSATKRPGLTKLLIYYNAATGLTSRSGDFRKGLQYGLALALGKKKWSFKQVGDQKDRDIKEQ